MKTPIQEICIISIHYPWRDQASYVFVEQLVSAFVDMGIRCWVVVPKSVTNSIMRKMPMPPRTYEAETLNGKPYTVLAPRFVTCSSLPGFLKSFGEHINNGLFVRAARKAARKAMGRRGFQPDIFYGHFFHCAGLAAAKLGNAYGRPFFVACGENRLNDVDDLGVDWMRSCMEGIAGVVAVSSANRDEVLKRNLAQDRLIKVFVNGINPKRFYPRDKEAIRAQWGFKQEDFIVCFVGGLIEVKGPLRLAAALRQLEGVKVIFAGKGGQMPDCPGILHCGPVAHEKVPELMSAADVFVLPTQAEGCCNAIIEAMACGLPVISSDMPFNYDVLNKGNAILIDPNNIDQIRDAIKTLRDDPERRRHMSQAALQTAAGLTVENRARRILAFLQERIADGDR